MITLYGYDITIFYRLFINILIVVSSLIVAYRAHKLYSLSSYNGFRIFRNSFLFFTIAFILDYYIFLIAEAYIEPFSELSFIILALLFYFFLSGAGFYLVYSLVWKEFEKFIPFLKKDIFSNKDLLLIADALIVAILTVFVNENIMFIIMIVVLGYAAHLSYNNYLESKYRLKKSTFPQLYFIAIILALLGYGLNYVVWFIPSLKYYVLTLTALVFLVFLYGVYYSAKKNLK